MTIFRPCIDIHHGKVVQIVGGTLGNSEGPVTNYTALRPPSFYADMYKEDGLLGGHVIMLGPDNNDAALDALKAWPNGLQVGGGISDANAQYWIDQGASKISGIVGKERLVIDLSCRRVKDAKRWFVAMNRWQTITSTEITAEVLASLAEYCSEFLVHAADVEGLCKGIDSDLVEALGAWSPIACTYAGGGRHISDLEQVDKLSGGRVDLTFGSALDIFGGSGVKYEDCVAWNKQQQQKST